MRKGCFYVIAIIVIAVALLALVQFLGLVTGPGFDP